MNLSSRPQQGKRRREQMGVRKKLVFLFLAIAMCLGILVYFRLWIIDYQISADDTEKLRRQFDLAHKEAMDESAEWRSRFDEERERATKCMKELTEVKESRGKISVERLQKENKNLLEKLGLLKQELESVKLKCKLQ